MALPTYFITQFDTEIIAVVGRKNIRIYLFQFLDNIALNT